MTDIEYLSNYDGIHHLVINPVSTSWSYKRARNIGGALLMEVPRLNKIETLPKREDTQDLLAETVRPGDVIISAGGDGCDNIVVDTLLTHPGLDEEVRKTPVLSDRGGNANMGPAELTPKTETGTPSIIDVIKYGIVVDASALLINAPPDQSGLAEGEVGPTEPEDFIAAYFSGFDLTGLSASHLHDVRENVLRRFKPTRNLVDGAAVLRAVMAARKRPFDATEVITQFTEDRQNPTILSQRQHTGLIDQSFVGGRRMAKVGYFPTSLTDREFFTFVLGDPRLRGIVRDGYRMRTETLPGQMIADNTMVSLSYESQDGKPIWAHIDGDPHLLPAKGKVEASLFPGSYRAVTTKPVE